MGERRRTTALAIGLLALVGGTTVIAGTAGAEDPLSPPQATTSPASTTTVVGPVANADPGATGVGATVGEADGATSTTSPQPTLVPPTQPGSTVPDPTVPLASTTTVGQVPAGGPANPPAPARSARPVVFDSALLSVDPASHSDGRLAAVEVSLTERPIVAAPITTTPDEPMPHGPSDAALAELRRCESSGDYGAVSWGGTYRGAYQFDQRTWDSVASRWLPRLVGTDPASAAPADQDRLARALYDERGWNPWPTCGWGL